MIVKVGRSDSRSRRSSDHFLREDDMLKNLHFGSAISTSGWKWYRAEFSIR